MPNNKMFYRILAVMAVMLTACVARAQQATAEPPAVADAGSWRVSLVTCGPGSDIYELEGHTGLRLVNEATGVDEVVNWGLFDFASPGFVYRFVKGETDYMAGAAPTESFLRMYEADGREVTEQVLELSPDEATRIVALVTDNLKPENRTYRYNYVADNCATRHLAIIERAIGDTLALGTPEEAIDNSRSVREAMRYYHRNYPWYQFGIDLALGAAIDRPEARRAMAFSPVALQQMMDNAILPSGKPLVASTSVMVAGKEGGVSAGPTPWYLTPAAVLWFVFAITLMVTVFDLFTGRLSRGYDVVLYTAFGLAGCIITFLVFFSVHEPASPNWLLLWLNPLCLLPLILIWTNGGRRLLMWWQMINFVALIAMCVVWIAGIQACNSAFIPLILSDGVRSLFFIFYTRCSTPQNRRRRPLVYRSAAPIVSYVR